MPFAQLVIGPPGSGKSTYCDGMHQFLSAIGRKCSVVNLDPANDRTSYPCALDIRDLVTLEEIMADEDLGPNGGVLYALEELEHNKQWLEDGLKGLGEDYVLFDCPGQVELFTHHSSLRNVFFRIQKLGYRVRFSLYAYNALQLQDELTCRGCTASGASSDRLVLSDASFSVHLDTSPFSESYVADGPVTSECLDKD